MLLLLLVPAGLDMARPELKYQVMDKLAATMVVGETPLSMDDLPSQSRATMATRPIEISAAGANIGMSVSCGGCKVDPKTNNEWITVKVDETSTGGHQVTATIVPNDTPFAREGKISVNGAEVKIFQQGISLPSKGVQ